MAAARFIVRGKVQGVFFRASTREQALDLALTGRATNLPNGDVEVIACGDERAIAALEAWLWKGPAAAAVTAVQRSDWHDQVPDGFVTG